MSPQSSPSSPITFELGPSFAAPDAVRLHEALSHTAPDSAVEIRFHRVREWEASALAVLARDLAECGSRISLLGLSERQLRVLGYLGVNRRG